MVDELAGQTDATQVQPLLHEPWAGPRGVPGTHEDVAGHQPHELDGVHEAQSVLWLHPAGGVRDGRE